MAWQNFFDVTLDVTAGHVTLTYIGNPTDEFSQYAALVLVPGAQPITLPTRLVNIDGEPWPVNDANAEAAAISTTTPEGGVFSTVSSVGNQRTQTVPVTTQGEPTYGIGLSVGNPNSAS